MMFGARQLPTLMICLFLCVSATVFGADIILNEYNAVEGNKFLNGGDSSADEDGGRASDSYLGRVQGNGGDWFELVVITDHLDMRYWIFDIYEDGTLAKSLRLSGDAIWWDLRSGTIITVSEDLPSDVSYNPAAGDWWINVQSNNDGDSRYFNSYDNFPVSNTDWQLTIKNAVGTVIFGPAGEGVSPLSGIDSKEIFKLEADPSAAITRDSADYEDASILSTFGSPNQWGLQSFDQLRSVVVPGASSLTLLSPNGAETLMGGTTETVRWQHSGTIASVIVEYSLDNGSTWAETDPPNVGNTGSYDWLVPIVDSAECLVRVVNAGKLSVYDTSNAVFTIFECDLYADLTGDCAVDMRDLAVMAEQWLE